MEELGGDPGARLTGSGGWNALLDRGDVLIAKAGAKIPALGSLLSHPALTTRGLLLALVGLLLLLILPPLVNFALRKSKRLEPNFRREWIPQSYGLLILLWSGILLVLAASLIPARASELHTWLLAVIGFGGLGLLDDLRGDKRIKGLKGHFRAAFRERCITTGFIKAVGGGLLALWIGHRLHPDSIPRAVFAGALIALAANAINLLDLRPGRAGSIFLASALVLLGVTVRRAGGVPPLLYIFLPALFVYERDARALVMMGDTGSNLLGACLGLAIATAPVSVFIKGLILLLLLGLHVLAERTSLTTLIERQPLLRALDRLTGVR